MKIQTLMTLELVAMCLSSHGALYSYTWTVGAAIPDSNPSGYVNNQTITDAMQGNSVFQPNPYIVNVVGVRLNISGGWNGDLVAYIRYDSGAGVGFTTLLNRVGTGIGNPIGYTDAGMNITLTDFGSYTDIHIAGTPASGITYLVDQTGSSTSFSSFQGLNPTTGTWSLFFADMSGNHISTLNSWGLDLEVVPEPVNVSLGVFGGVLGLAVLRKKLKSSKSDAKTSLSTES